MRTPLLTWLIVTVASTTPQTALALGADGHEAVCEIAYQELTPTAKQAVDQIMSTETDTRFQTFRDSCVWPDHIGPQRARSAEHYSCPSSKIFFESEQARLVNPSDYSNHKVDRRRVLTRSN